MDTPIPERTWTHPSLREQGHTHPREIMDTPIPEKTWTHPSQREHGHNHLTQAELYLFVVSICNSTHTHTQTSTSKNENERYFYYTQGFPPPQGTPPQDTPHQGIPLGYSLRVLPQGTSQGSVLSLAILG